MMHRPKRTIRREQRYAAPRGVPFEPDVDAPLIAEADDSHRSVAAVTRDCLRRGLPLVQDAKRKRERNARAATRTDGS